MAETQQEPGQVLLTAAKVAEIFQVEERTIRRWAGRGDLPVVRVGGVLRFNRQQILAIAGGDPTGGVPDVCNVRREPDAANLGVIICNNWLASIGRQTAPKCDLCALGPCRFKPVGDGAVAA